MKADPGRAAPVAVRPGSIPLGSRRSPSYTKPRPGEFRPTRGNDPSRDHAEGRKFELFSTSLLAPFGPFF